MFEKLSPLSIIDENYCVCMIKNASTVFVFWKFSEYYLMLFKQLKLSQTIRIKIYSENDNRCIADVPSNYFDGGCYVNIPYINGRIKAVIFCVENNSEKELCYSNSVSLSYEKELFKDYNFIQ